MNWLRAIIALAIVELVGLAVLRSICEEPRRWKALERAGIAFACGLVALPSWLLLASFAGFAPALWLGVVELVVLAPIAALRARSRTERPRVERPEHPPAPLARGIELASLVWIALTCATVGVASLLEPIVEWDVIAIWALKAKVLLAEPVGSAKYFHDPALAFSHLDYPLLWPFAIAWVWSIVGSSDLVAPKILAPALLGATAALLFGILRRLGNRTEAALFTAVAVGLPMVLAVTSRLLADAPLALFVLGSFGCFRLWLDSDHGDDLRLTGFFAAGMVLTKNDGLGLLAVLVVAALLAAPTALFANRARGALWLAIFPLALASPWLWFRSSLPRWSEDYEARLGALLSHVSADRAGAALRAWLSALGEVSDWLVFWPVVFVATCVGWRALRQPGTSFAAAALLLGFALYVCITIISPWELGALIESAQHRLIAHLAPLGVLLLAEITREGRLLARDRRDDE